MKAFIVLLAVACASAQPFWYSGMPLAYNTMPMMVQSDLKPVEYKQMEIKPVEYKMETSPIAYKAMPVAYNTMPVAYNAMPWAYNSMPYAMPLQVKTYANDDKEDAPEYAMKGKYYAESAGAIHRARRDAQIPLVGAPLTTFSPYTTTYTTSAINTPYINTFYNRFWY